MYQPGYGNFEEFLGAGFFIAYLIFILISLVIGVITYVLNALGLSKIARKMGHPTPYFAWIPFVSTYLIGELAKDEIKRVKNINLPHTLYDNLGIALILIPLIGAAFVWIPFIGIIPYIAALVFYIILMCIALFHIYKQFVGDSTAIGFVVLYYFLPPAAMLYIGSKEILYPNAFTEMHTDCRII